MMLYKQPVMDLLEKSQNLLKSVLVGMENNTISAIDAFQKLKLLDQYQAKLREYIEIEKE